VTPPKVVRITVAVGCAATLAIAGMTVATAGNRSTVHACVSSRTGAVRIAASCHSNERLVTWPSRGKRGRVGQAGATGKPTKVYYDGSAAFSRTVATFGDWRVRITCAQTEQLGFELTVGPRSTGTGPATLQVQQMTSSDDSKRPTPSAFFAASTVAAPGEVINTNLLTGVQRYIGTAWIQDGDGPPGQLDFSIYLNPADTSHECLVAGIATP
jgi:hypothetical protein